MPHISFRNVDSKDIEIFCHDTTKQLAKVIGCPSDWLTFYDTQTKAIIDNKIEPTTCFITVEWFKRTDEIKREVASIIDSKLRELNKEEIIVRFIDLEKENYFENMEQF